eukprot:TRINITY_DN10184_c0_g1_i3.p1 TRINITY_DN10184_c0_g1~~TRINITY_DN10184_c0_g1_i3.p1  ORF type:complete len:145 (+),score=32.31 TRINITY_DN10184_c0_g1_i3:103-537(+)
MLSSFPFHPKLSTVSLSIKHNNTTHTQFRTGIPYDQTERKMPYQNKHITYPVQLISAVAFTYFALDLAHRSHEGVFDHLSKNGLRNLNFLVDDLGLFLGRLIFLTEAIGQVFVAISAYSDKLQEHRLFRNNFWSDLGGLPLSVA